MDIIVQRADQAIGSARNAWRTQRQQLQVLGSALLLLLTIVVWERSQWTQQPRSDLLQDLPNSFPETWLEYTLKTGQPAAVPECWSCAQSTAFFAKQQQQLTQLSLQSETLCALASETRKAGGTQLPKQAGLCQPAIVTDASHALQFQG